MITPEEINIFFDLYDPEIAVLARHLRALLIEQLPAITEQLDLPAKMVAYSYGPKYIELICVIIPSKKGLKLGFNRGVELSDPDKLLAGTAKVSRYVVINSLEQIQSTTLASLLNTALAHYEMRTNS